MTKEVLTIESSAPLLDALTMMISNRVKSIVIPPRDKSDTFALLTFADIADKVIAADERVESLNVYDLMVKPCVALDEHWNVRHAAKLMSRLRIRRAIVTEGHELRGLLSITDIVATLVEKEED